MTDVSHRGATDLCGILAVDKPQGMTSHDVVSSVRRLSGERRVGHGGTLDPAAGGLLVLAVGPATRLTRFFLAGPKTYRARIVFGAETDTLDAEGTVVATSLVPLQVADVDFARDHVSSLVGRHEQTPPAYSAVKIGGRKAYDVARRGDSPALEPREIEVFDASLVDIEEGPPVAWTVHLAVSKGTYVRSLARDIGRAVGTHAHLGSLTRTASGALTLDVAWSLEDLEGLSREGRFADAFLRGTDALGMPIVGVSDETARAVSHGARIPPPTHVPQTESGLFAITEDNRLLAVYRLTPEGLVPEVVLPGGCA